MKICGYYKEIDGCMCFVENARGNMIIHEKIPMEQYKRTLENSKAVLKDLVTMDCQSLAKRYGH